MGKDLFLAAQAGNVAKLESLLSSKGKSKSLGPLASLRRGPNVNSQDASGNTALHFAALNGKAEAVEYLLQMDASANIPDNQGSYPLHLAAFNGHSDVIKVLICRGPSRARVNEQNVMGDTALHMGAQYGHSGAVRALLENHADARVRNNRQETPLDLAANYGKLTTVQMLVLSDPGLTLDYVFEHSPLHLAARNGHTAVVDFLLDRGMDINTVCSTGTALHEAALCGKTDVVKLLLQRGADVKSKNTTDETVLDLMVNIPSQRSQEITALIYEQLQYQGAVDPFRSKAMTYTGQQPDFAPPGSTAGTFPAHQKLGRPSLSEIFLPSAGDNENQKRRLASSAAPIAGAAHHPYHCLNYPKIERMSGDYSLAAVSPVSQSPEKVDFFDYTVNDMPNRNANSEDKENKDLRHSLPAGIGTGASSTKSTQAEPPKRPVSADRAAESYDFVPIRYKRASGGSSEQSSTRSALGIPQNPSLTYDFVQPHPRPANNESTSGSVVENSRVSAPSPINDPNLAPRLLSPEQKTSSLESNASDYYKSLTLDEKDKYSSMENRYQKLTYDNVTIDSKKASHWEEYEGYKVMAPPQQRNEEHAPMDDDMGESASQLYDVPPAVPKRDFDRTDDDVYHLLPGPKEEPSTVPATRGDGEGQGDAYHMLPSPRAASKDDNAVSGVYCMLGDGWGQPNRKVEESIPQKQQVSPKAEKRSPSPNRMKVRVESQSMFYEVPPMRTRIVQDRSGPSVYETPPMRIIEKEPEKKEAARDWVTYDSEEADRRPKSKLLGSSMFYTGSAVQTSPSENSAGTLENTAVENLPEHATYSKADSPRQASVAVKPDSIVFQGQSATGDLLSPGVPPPSPGTAAFSIYATISKSQGMESSVNEVGKISSVVEVPEPVDVKEAVSRVPAPHSGPEAKPRSSSSLERSVDPFSYVSRKADSNSPIVEESESSQFVILHKNFDPHDKIEGTLTPLETYDNVYLKNRPIQSITSQEPKKGELYENVSQNFNLPKDAAHEKPSESVRDDQAQFVVKSPPEPVSTINRLEVSSEIKTMDIVSSDSHVSCENPPESVANENPPESVANENPPESIANENPPESIANENPPESIANENTPGAISTEPPSEMEERGPSIASSFAPVSKPITIKASGIKQKRTTLERTEGLLSPSKDKIHAKDYRLSSLPVDKALNESYEWTKIDRFLESLEDFAEEDVASGERSISQESLSAFLDSLGMGQYEATFIGNGYDDIKYMGGIISEEEDLHEIGIQKEEHVRTLLQAIAMLPEPPQIGSDIFPIPASVTDWLEKIELSSYESKFVRSGYDTMDRVRLIWEFELQTIIEVNLRGHRKRMIHSLGNWINSQQLQRPHRTWAEKFADADDGKPKASASEHFVDDSMDVANQLLRTAEDLALDMAKRKSQSSISEIASQTPSETASQTPSETASQTPSETASKAQPSERQQVETSTEMQMTTPVPLSPTTPTNSRVPRYKPHFSAGWKHAPEVLLYKGVSYKTKYLGSHFVTQIRGTASTLDACQKMMNSSKLLEKVPDIMLHISVRGIDYVDKQSEKVISSYDIRNISYCAQFPSDLHIFAYITKDSVTKKHYCHVFRGATLNTTDEIILTIGQCFELAYEQHRLLVDALHANNGNNVYSHKTTGQGRETGVAITAKPKAPPKPTPFEASTQSKER